MNALATRSRKPTWMAASNNPDATSATVTWPRWRRWAAGAATRSASLPAATPTNGAKASLSSLSYDHISPEQIGEGDLETVRGSLIHAHARKGIITRCWKTLQGYGGETPRTTCAFQRDIQSRMRHVRCNGERYKGINGKWHCGGRMTGCAYVSRWLGNMITRSIGIGTQTSTTAPPTIHCTHN